ncbi:MAG: AbrB/MazE/SpoVT family DNA-binding domain-containing protein [Myxococcota bacterium]
MHALKLIQVGKSLGIILPKEIVAKLQVEKGDTLFVTETPDGLRLTPHDPSVAEQVEAGREFMCEFRDTFHRLAR